VGAELTANFEERTRIVATRQIFGSVAAFVMAGVGFGYFFADERGGRMNPDAYAPFAAVVSVVMVTTILASAWFTRDQIPFLPTSRKNALEQRCVPSPQAWVLDVGEIRSF